MNDLTPSQIVSELDQYIIGQENAKKAVAIALRNRIRRQKLPPELIDEVTPKNIIMIGPTGVGKTEIVKRLAKLVKAPFVKVEATKFTEVGYVGRDVDSIIRDITEVSVQLVRKEWASKVEDKAKQLVDEKIVDYLFPVSTKRKEQKTNFLDGPFSSGIEEEEKKEPFDILKNKDEREERLERTRKKFKDKLEKGELENRLIEIEVEENTQPTVEIFSNSGIEGMGINFKDILGRMFPQKRKKQKVTIAEARKILLYTEAQKLIDMDEVIRDAVDKVENLGIVFIDEIDKIATQEKSYGPDVSRGGVQRDILPIIEGSTVMTKYGAVKTDHILFIAAGAFTTSKPSDLIPELQGRFPIRVELNILNKEDLKRILTEPRNSLIKQYVALLATEDLKIEITDDAIDEIAETSFLVNEQTENIGARRLYTVLEKLLEDISFNAPSSKKKQFTIDKRYVRKKLQSIVRNEDLSRYIL
ncbi:MAG: ATP-dependent protease ATPase subunit HslU [Candidatus Atribacteria bacterium]|nr:ATP-dependent protease ATPase subunit HslU [Candidatus Atribacteria bacterium]MBE3093369.1 ATP-dependent protease ATPase subunit HslU [Chloroflexota bacterium]MBE3126807.1 ATP-dependent protease ATPase subunit HslU [Candidatus Atribacteria bacterium]